MTEQQRPGLGRPWRRMKANVISRDGGICQLRYAGVCIETATTADHIVPRSQGGSDKADNLRASCVPCNMKKNNKNPNHPGLVATITDQDRWSRQWI